MKTAVFCLLLSFFCWGSDKRAALPSEFLTADSYARQFRSFLSNKITQMNQNFVRETREREVFYYSQEALACQDGTKTSSRQKLFRIHYSQSLEKERYVEHRFYYGCNGRLSFRETYRAQGVEKPVHERKQIFAGEMDFKKLQSFKSFSYELADENLEPVFEINSAKSSKLDFMSFKINGQKIMARQTKSLKDKKIVQYFSYPIEFEMARNGHVMKMRVDAAFENYISAHFSGQNILYFNQKKERISLADFQKHFHFRGLGMIMDSILAALPKTSFVTSNLSGGKMLKELRDAQTFLISGTQLNLVRNLIEDYIKAVQEGAIVDNRK